MRSAVIHGGQRTSMFMSKSHPQKGVTFMTTDPIIRSNAAAREGCYRVERGLEVIR